MTGAPFTYGSVCSGIEAASVAWEPLGWKAAFFSEIEAFPRAVLAHRWPGVKCHGDFTTIREKQYDPVDLLVGGTPCQSFSVAGLRGGLADERGNLALEYLRLAGRLRPSWLLWENVPGVLSSNGGRDFGAFLGGLGQLGYGFAYRVLDAQYFGLAQRRKRVFVVGYLGDWRRAAAVLFEPTSLRRDTPPRQKTRVRTSASSPSSFGGYRDGCGTLRANEGDYGGGTETLITPLAFGGGNRSGSIDVAAACLASDGRLDFESNTFVIAHTLRASSSSEDGTGQGVPLVPISFKCNSSFGEHGIDICGTLQAENAHAVTQPYTLAIRGRGDSHDLEYRQDGTANALLTPGGGRSGIGVGAIAFTQNQRDELRLLDVTADAGMHQQTFAVQRAAVRRLTPRECCRLQGFPDDYLDIEYRGKPAADGPKYRALGNSMAVPVVRWIGARIAAEHVRA